MTWEWTTATALNVAAVAPMVTFGVLVAMVRPRSAQATAVAVFSVAFAVSTGSINLLLVAGASSASGPVFGWLAGTTIIVACIALLRMWWVLPSPHHMTWPVLVVPTMFIIGTGFWALPVWTGRAGSPTVAALGASSWLYFGGAGILGGIWWGLLLLLAHGFAPGGSDPETSHIPLLAGALVLYPTTNMRFLFGTDSFLARASWLVLAYAVIVSAVWLWAGHRAGRPRAGRNVAWLTLALILVVVLLGGAAFSVWTGLARIATVAVLAYAVVRHRVLGMDAKLRFGISKSTLAGVFIAVFFIASEAAQQFFGERFESGYLGILAAGALVFAIAPLSRMADRLAAKAVPLGTVPAGEHAPNRPDTTDAAYRAALRAAMRDGLLTRREELHLAEVAEGLGIGARRALELRGEVEEEAD